MEELTYLYLDKCFVKYPLYRDVLYIKFLCIIPKKVIFYLDITREIMDGA